MYEGYMGGSVLYVKSLDFLVAVKQIQQTLITILFTDI